MVIHLRSYSFASVHFAFAHFQPFPGLWSFIIRQCPFSTLSRLLSKCMLFGLVAYYMHNHGSHPYVHDHSGCPNVRYLGGHPLCV